ncbi:MAG: NAD-dependent epimerase/dehydratase family protein [Promethearchaeota archaeon]
MQLKDFRINLGEQCKKAIDVDILIIGGLLNMREFKKILITGSNGFVGTNLIKVLCEKSDFLIRAMILKGTDEEVIKEFQIRYNDEFRKMYNLSDDFRRIEIVYGDLLDLNSLKKCVEGVDTIIHLAGLVTDWAPKKLFFKLIVEGTDNLLNAIRLNGDSVKRFIYMSSLTVHNLNGHYYDDETAPRDMKFFPYGVAKRQAEDLVTEWAEANKTKGVVYAIVRPGFIIYGPYDKGSFILALNGILNGKFGFINGGRALISYVYSENLAYGIELLAEAKKVRGVYIILDGNLSWKEFVKKWTDAFGVEMPKLSAPYGLVFPAIWLLEKIYKLFRAKKSPILNLYTIRIPRKDLAFKCDKIKRECGYEPIVNFDESIMRTLEYYKEWKTKRSSILNKKAK